jgi:ribose transport system permease protein
MTTTLLSAEPNQSSRRRSLLHKATELQSTYPILQTVALVVILIAGGSTLPGLLTVSGLRQMLVIAALAGIAASGQTLVVLIGGIDLSVAGVITAAGLAASQLPAQYHMSLGALAPVILCVAAVIGGAVGYLCHRFELNPLIVTLGSGAATVGAIQVLANNTYGGMLPAWLGNLTSPIESTFGIAVPPVIVLWVVLAIGLHVLLRYTGTGQHIYATGANRVAADLARVRTRRVWIGVFAFSACMSAAVGLLLAGFAGSVDLTLGNPYLFQSLAAVMIGGTAMGRRGDYNRTVLGALLITTITTILVGHGLSAAGQQVLYGVTILVAVIVYSRERSLRDRV